MRLQATTAPNEKNGTSPETLNKIMVHTVYTGKTVWSVPLPFLTGPGTIFLSCTCTCSQKARLHERKKWSGSDKKWNGSADKFLRVNDTWPVPVLSVPFKKGSIGAYGPFSERNG